MRYEINPENFAVSLYDGVELEPFQFQPDYPNYDAFDSYKEAEEWAKLAIKSHAPTYGFYAPNGKGLTGEPKPTEEQKREAKLQSLGLSVAELRQLLGL